MTSAENSACTRARRVNVSLRSAAGSSSAARIAPRKRRGIAGRNQAAGLRPEHFRDAADIGGDQRNGGGGGLQDDVGQGFAREMAPPSGGRARRRRAPASRRESAPTPPSPSRSACARNCASSGPAPTMVALTARPSRGKLRERIEQHVDALEHAQLADEHDVGRVGLRRDFGELLRRDAVVHDAHQRRAACRSCAVNASRP